MKTLCLVVSFILAGAFLGMTLRIGSERRQDERNEKIANLVISKLAEKNQSTSSTLTAEKAPTTLEVTSDTTTAEIPQFFGGKVSLVWRPVVGPLRMLGLTGQEAITVVRTIRPPATEEAFLSPSAVRHMDSLRLAGELRRFDKQPEGYLIEAKVETVRLNGQDQLVVVDWRRRTQ